jgi:REP element-mobilizing transposase RayT
MPVYVFTYHAYRSWMPDHKRGFVRRKEGVLPADFALANVYRQQAVQEEIDFDAGLQKLLIDELQIACAKQSYELHFVATEPTHVHALVSWRTGRTWVQVRAGLRSLISRRLNREHGRRAWLSDGASRKKVKDQAHFDRLAAEYLPKHRGWKWHPGRGLFK